MKLDLTQSYGTLHGNLDLARFVQNGRYFDCDGNELELRLETPTEFVPALDVVVRQEPAKPPPAPEWRDRRKAAHPCPNGMERRRLFAREPNEEEIEALDRDAEHRAKQRATPES